MIKIQLMPYELSAKAFEIYSNSDFTFYWDDNIYYCSVNSKDIFYKIGTLQDVEDYLLTFDY